MFYLDVLTEFYKAHVEYLIVGGVAVNLLGVPRVTTDMDIVISMEKENVKKVISILEKLNFIPLLPVNSEILTDNDTINDWKTNRNLTAFSFYNKQEPYKVIDIILDNKDFDKSFTNKTIINLGEIEIYVASELDIIEMKQKSAREQDLSDIEMLEKVRRIRENERLQGS